MSTPSPVAKKPTQASPSSLKVLKLALKEDLYFARGMFKVLLTGPSSNSFQPNGGFEMVTCNEGVMVTDPTKKSRTLVPWSSVASVNVEYSD